MGLNRLGRVPASENQALGVPFVIFNPLSRPEDEFCGEDCKRPQRQSFQNNGMPQLAWLVYGASRKLSSRSTYAQ